MITYEKERSNKSGYIYHQTDHNLNFGTHIHSSAEYIYLLDGEMILSVEGKSFTMKKGDAALILPNQAHSYKTQKESESYLCVFSTDYTPDFFEKYKLYEADTPVFTFDEVEKDYNDILQRTTSVFQTKAMLYAICAVFEYRSTFHKRDLKFYDTVAEIIQYIEDNYASNISLASLSEKLGYNYNYTSNLFNSTFGTSFLQLVNEYRIAKADILLESTDLSVTEISIQCGYNSLRSFNRNYLAIKGKSPKKANTKKKTK